MQSTMGWPEPIVRVQDLSESGLKTIPSQYIKLELDRPKLPFSFYENDNEVNVPVIDLGTRLESDTLEQIHAACREWGFFQIINHGVRPDLMDRAREVWREFFHLPMEEKQKYGNTPETYEGYGSRLGVEKGALLDWSDYYFLHYLPPNLKDHGKWPAQPPYHREVLEEYLEELVKLGGRVMKMLSKSLGMKEDTLQNAFGGDDVGVCLRVNFYPKCPQPDLTLGLSPHSDPGGITVLLPDLNVAGLQVRKDGKWVTVKPAPHSFIVNIGDQMQVASNAIYKSIEHRVIVNPNEERISLAFFYNPGGDIPIEPTKELVTPESPALYQPMTYNEYRLYVRRKGLHGKAQVESLKSPR